MFHLILSACLAMSGAECGQILLPAGDARDLAGCEAEADRIASAWLADRPELTGGTSDCRANAELPAADLRELAPGVFAHFGTSRQMEETADGRIANLGVVIGQDAVAVIDAGVSRAEGQAMHVAIRRLTDLPIRHLILTHMHPDHVLGAEVMAEAGAQITAHHALPPALEARAGSYLQSLQDLYPASEWIGTRIALPDRLVEDRDRIDLGDRHLDLQAWPAAHTDSDLTVRDSATGTLFTGDLLFRDLTPVVDGSLKGWLDWMAGDPAAGAALIVPGHGLAATSWSEASGPQQDFLTALATQTRAAIAAGLAMSEAVPVIAEGLQPYGTFWNSYPATVARNATAAYKELEWD